MCQRTLRSRIAAWMALVAIGMVALAPAVPHALAAARGEAAWWVVCSLEGSRLVAADSVGNGAGDEPAPARASSSLEQCPFCAPSMAAAPPPSPLVLPAVAPARAMPALFLAAPRTLHAWRTAQPRGPPSFL